MPRDQSRFIVDPLPPAYLGSAVRASLPARVAAAREELYHCRACPRACGADRAGGKLGTCRVGRLALVASAFSHHGEESCLSGRRGSGTLFFASCNLHCVFCQNWDISQRPSGQPTEAGEIAQLMLDLQGQGCHNINLVTPEHVVPQVVEALAAAIERGLSLPVVYNTSGYDTPPSLKLLDGLVDIYMPDFKFWRGETAARLCKAADYPGRARVAIREMHRQCGDLRVTRDGIACRGLLVRHLVMPGLIEESAAIFRWLAEEISPDTFVNIMRQYHPENEVGEMERPGAARGTIRYAEINRRPTRAELEQVYEAARAVGLWRFDV